MKSKKSEENLRFIIMLVMGLAILIAIWMRGGFKSLFLDTDLGRDLYEMSNIWLGKIVWLGPRLSPGFPSSPIYYYVFFPFLWVARGNANSIFIANVLLAASVLTIFAWFIKKQFNIWLVIPVMFFIGLSPWWRGNTIHPGNGYTYVLWLFLSLIFMWFEMPLFLSALSLGLAISYHPAAIFAILFLFYEWLRRKHSLISFSLILFGLLIPWVPIILFEIITKGFLTRSWMANPATGIKLAVSFFNLQQIISGSGLGNVLFVLIFLFSALKTEGRSKTWLILSFLPLIILLFLSNVQGHYLTGIVTAIMFVFVLNLLTNNLGRVIIVLVTFFFLIQILLISPKPGLANRSIPKMSLIVERLIKSKKFDKNQKIAVIAVLDNQTKVPQADDYRFFLRIKGFNVLESTEYAQADKLIMFVEEADFKWQDWQTWETEQFGQRKVNSIIEFQKIKIIIFDKSF